MQVVLSILPFILVGVAWCALSVYMRRGDRTVQAARPVWRLPEPTITPEQLRRVAVAMTVSFEQFAENMRQVQAAIAKAAPTMQQFLDRMNQRPPAA